MKAVIVVLSDPKSGSDGILFQGAGTRWIGEVSKSDHAAHALFEEVKDKVAGVSSGCADVFGATEDAEKSGFDLIKDNPVPGTTGASKPAKAGRRGLHRPDVLTEGAASCRPFA